MDISWNSPLAEAGMLIRQRWADSALKKEVAAYFGCPLDPLFDEQPFAVLSRNLASPDLEFLRFMVLATEAGLAPIVFESHHDKFTSNNWDKLCFAKLNIFDGFDKNGQVRRHSKKIIDIPAHDGKRICNIQTLWGENLVTFHRKLLAQHSPAPVQLFDDVAWFKANCGGSTAAKDYYQFALAYYICHGVLFENFTFVNGESQFTEEVFLPAFESVTQRFGLKPLIVPIIPEDELESPYWFCYPPAVERSIPQQHVHSRKSTKLVAATRKAAEPH